jgi:hypothetical protein
MSKFRFHGRATDPAGIVRGRYEAEFWEAPIHPGQKGRYVLTQCETSLIDGRLTNESMGVSYYADLYRAMTR